MEKENKKLFSSVSLDACSINFILIWSIVWQKQETKTIVLWELLILSCQSFRMRVCHETNSTTRSGFNATTVIFFFSLFLFSYKAILWYSHSFRQFNISYVSFFFFFFHLIPSLFHFVHETVPKILCTSLSR